MAVIDLKTIDYLAELARIKLDNEEKFKLMADLEKILEYVSQLDMLDTANVEPARHVLPYVNVLRADKVNPSLQTEEALKNAPEKTGSMFRVPGII